MQIWGRWIGESCLIENNCKEPRPIIFFRTLFWLWNDTRHFLFLKHEQITCVSYCNEQKQNDKMKQLTPYQEKSQQQSLENDIHFSLNLEFSFMEDCNLERRTRCKKKKLKICINCIEPTVQTSTSSMRFSVFSAYITVHVAQEWWW